MGWPWHFLTLTEAQKHDRRYALDISGIIAQYSVLIPLSLLFLISHARRLLQRRSGYKAVPGSPYLKYAGTTSEPWSSRVRIWARKVSWWSSESYIDGWGKKGEWVWAIVWTAWLLLLCVVRTGDDYLHLTKRFGIVGASQLPFHYLLAMKSPYSPLQYLTGLSHEQLNKSHQILGRITTFLFVLHAILYLNFFIQSNLLVKRLQESDVILGLIGMFLFAIVGTTALGFLRHWNYRVFYGIHITLATILLPVLYFHVHHIRAYILETALLYAMQTVLRLLSTRTYSGTISQIPNTNLTRIIIPLSESDSGTWHPGQHIYLSVPKPKRHHTGDSIYSRLMGIWWERLLSNPFTIASLPRDDGDLTLIARTLKGTTRSMAAIAKDMNNGHNAAQLLFKAEGPYGAANRLPDFSKYERILLVAGGVGATFTLPMFRYLLHAGQANSVRFLWVVKSMAETEWMLNSLAQHEEQAAVRQATLEVYVTRSRRRSNTHGRARQGSSASANRLPSIEETEESIELQTPSTKRGARQETIDEKTGAAIRSGRPALAKVIDEVFSGMSVQESSIAVLVCGPATMTSTVRAEVGKYAKVGWDVFFWAEEFGL